MGQLDFGEKGHWHNVLNARSYVAPKASAKHQLQLVHEIGGMRGIAHEPDLTGLIVLQSDPIDVIVTRPLPPGTISAVPLLVILGIGALWGGIGIVRRLRSRASDAASSTVLRLSWLARRPLAYASGFHGA